MKKIYCATAYGVGVLYIGKFYNREEENKKIAITGYTRNYTP
jgi:hypothetical protein